jgi:hypothetical protein
VRSLRVSSWFKKSAVNGSDNIQLSAGYVVS